MFRNLVVLLAFAPWTFAVAATAPEVEPTLKENKQVSAVLSEVSSKNIEATIRKLVSFGTRHTLSDAQSETRGIGAARRWIQSEFERYNKENGGRLEVTMDEFTQPPRRTESATGPGRQCRGDSARDAAGIARSDLCRERSLRFTRD